MAEITDRKAPADVPTTNALDDIHIEVDGPPPAFLTLGTTPAPVYNAPELDETRTYMVRVRCTGKHGPLKRADGEVRYKRDLAIQAIWVPGEVEPKSKEELEAEAKAEAEANQPPLFSDDGTEDPDADGDEDQDDYEEEDPDQ